MERTQPPPGLPWQRGDRDIGIRSDMIQRIANMLVQQRRNPEQAFIDRVPMIAQRVEERLYRKAQSEQEYLDMSTLNQRLQIAIYEIRRPTSNGSGRPAESMDIGQPGGGVEEAQPTTQQQPVTQGALKAKASRSRAAGGVMPQHMEYPNLHSNRQPMIQPPPQPMPSSQMPSHYPSSSENAYASHRSGMGSSLGLDDAPLGDFPPHMYSQQTKGGASHQHNQMQQQAHHVQPPTIQQNPMLGRPPAPLSMDSAQSTGSTGKKGTSKAQKVSNSRPPALDVQRYVHNESSNLPGGIAGSSQQHQQLSAMYAGAGSGVASSNTGNSGRPGSSLSFDLPLSPFSSAMSAVSFNMDDLMLSPQGFTPSHSSSNPEQHQQQQQPHHQLHHQHHAMQAQGSIVGKQHYQTPQQQHQDMLQMPPSGQGGYYPPPPQSLQHSKSQQPGPPQRPYHGYSTQSSHQHSSQRPSQPPPPPSATHAGMYRQGPQQQLQQHEQHHQPQQQQHQQWYRNKDDSASLAQRTKNSFIQEQQQRYLRLRHATKCLLATGTCSEPECVEMQQLWGHIKHCKNTDCSYSHCASMRYFIGHVQGCKEDHCEACIPIREAESRDTDKLIDEYLELLKQAKALQKSIKVNEEKLEEAKKRHSQAKDEEANAKKEFKVFEERLSTGMLLDPEEISTIKLRLDMCKMNQRAAKLQVDYLQAEIQREKQRKVEQTERNRQITQEIIKKCGSEKKARERLQKAVNEHNARSMWNQEQMMKQQQQGMVTSGPPAHGAMIAPKVSPVPTMPSNVPDVSQYGSISSGTSGGPRPMQRGQTPFVQHKSHAVSPEQASSGGMGMPANQAFPASYTSRPGVTKADIRPGQPTPPSYMPPPPAMNQPGSGQYYSANGPAFQPPPPGGANRLNRTSSQGQPTLPGQPLPDAMSGGHMRGVSFPQPHPTPPPPAPAPFHQHVPPPPPKLPREASWGSQITSDGSKPVGRAGGGGRGKKGVQTAPNAMDQMIPPPPPQPSASSPAISTRTLLPSQPRGLSLPEKQATPPPNYAPHLSQQAMPSAPPMNAGSLKPTSAKMMVPPPSMPQRTPPLAPSARLSPSDMRVVPRPPEITRNTLENSYLLWENRHDIEAHIESLSRYKVKNGNFALARNFDPTKNFKAAAQQMLKRLLDLPHANIFKTKVDPIALGIPDYFERIKRPMDLGTIKQHLESKTNPYRSLSEFAADVRLTFNNAVEYNGETSEVGIVALEFGKIFEREYNALRAQEDEAFERGRYVEGNCRLCSQTGDFYFEPPTYYCEGMHCDGNKIKRDAWMYVFGDHHVCRHCYSVQTGTTLQIDGEKLPKQAFVRRKNDEEFKEEWIRCSWCKRRFHAICAMAKCPVQSKADYLCPFCALRCLDDRKLEKSSQVLHQNQIRLAHQNHTLRYNNSPNAPPLQIPPPIQEPKRWASDLPETPLSRHLERRVCERVEAELKTAAANRKCNMRDLDEPGRLTVRVVLNKQEELITRETMIQLYGNPPHNYPKSFPNKQKCVLLFERIDGVDVLLFIMFLQYYGSDSPAPNQRSLYIAYLDSVNYFTAGQLRTVVYHELIESLLEYERKNGYTRCFIWACPPQGGDDYIFNIHPRDQRVPDATKLRNWYFDLLEHARQRGIVISMNNLFDEYFARVPYVTHVPYFEGDWWQAYGEHYIKSFKDKRSDPLDLQTKEEAAKNLGGIRSSRYVQERNRRKRPRKGANLFVPGEIERSISNVSTASGLGDEQADPEASQQAPVQPQFPSIIQCPPPRLLEQVPIQDNLTAKIAHENERMKRDFIVVKLYDECSECGTPMDQPGLIFWKTKAYDPALDPHRYSERSYAPPFALCHDCYVKAYEVELKEPFPSHEFVPPIYPPPEWRDDTKVAMPGSDSTATMEQVLESPVSGSQPVANQSSTPSEDPNSGSAAQEVESEVRGNLSGSLSVDSSKENSTAPTEASAIAAEGAELERESSESEKPDIETNHDFALEDAQNESVGTGVDVEMRSEHQTEPAAKPECSPSVENNAGDDTSVSMALEESDGLLEDGTQSNPEASSVKESKGNDEDQMEDSKDVGAEYDVHEEPDEENNEALVFKKQRLSLQIGEGAPMKTDTSEAQTDIGTNESGAPEMSSLPGAETPLVSASTPRGSIVRSSSRKSQKLRKRPDNGETDPEDSMIIEDGPQPEIEVLEVGKCARPPNPYYRNPCSVRDMVCVRTMIRPETIDQDPPMESTIFDSRKQFLSVCQKHRLQFDELRRAKYSTMVLLDMLLNPESDSFGPFCASCRTDLSLPAPQAPANSSPQVYQACITCADHNLCLACFGNVKAEPGHQFEVRGGSAVPGVPHANQQHAAPYVQHQQSAYYQGASGAYMAVNRQMAMLQRNLQLLMHASACMGCVQSQCTRMKNVIMHARQCQLRSQGQLCEDCRRYYNLVQYHVKMCRTHHMCPVYGCDRVKAHLRHQQLAVSDRRVLIMMRNQEAEAAAAASGGANGGSPVPPESGGNSNNGTSALTSSESTTFH